MRIPNNKSIELQKEAKALYKKGFNNKEIAEKLSVQPKTVGLWLKHFKDEFLEAIKTKTLLIKRINEALSNPKTKPSEIKDLFASLSLYKKTDIV